MRNPSSYFAEWRCAVVEYIARKTPENLKQVFFFFAWTKLKCLANASRVFSLKCFYGCSRYLPPQKNKNKTKTKTKNENKKTRRHNICTSFDLSVIVACTGFCNFSAVMNIFFCHTKDFKTLFHAVCFLYGGFLRNCNLTQK